MNDENKPGNAETPATDPELEAEADAILADSGLDASLAPAAPADQAEPPAVPLDQALAQFLDIVFNGFLKQRGEYWAMDAAELQALSKAYAAAIAKYQPDFNLGVELTCVLVTITTIGPRLVAHAKAHADDADDAGDAAQPDAGAATQTPVESKGSDVFQTDG